MGDRIVDTAVGGVSLEVWKAGDGVVTRRDARTAPRWSDVRKDGDGSPPVAYSLVDPSHHELVPVSARLAAAGFTGSAVAFVAAGLLANADAWQATFALTAAVLLGLVGAAGLHLWRSAGRGVSYVVLSRAAVGEYRLALAKAWRSLGHAPTRAEEAHAADRLWELAQTLAVGERQSEA